MENGAIKIILYLIAGILTAPGAALAYFVWTVDGATRQKNLFELLFFVFDRFIDTIAWSFWLLLPGVTIWLVFALVAKYRFVGASGMALIAVASLIVMFAVSGPPKASGDLFFPFLSLAGLLLNGWLVWTQVAAWPAR